MAVLSEALLDRGLKLFPRSSSSGTVATGEIVRGQNMKYLCM